MDENFENDDFFAYVKKKLYLCGLIMEFDLALHRLGSWLKHQLSARHTGGHGVHSPYLFELVRMIMHDSNSFYAWDIIEQHRERLMADEREVVFVDYGSGAKVKGEERIQRVCDIAKKSLVQKKYAQLLARLVNWLGQSAEGLHIVELGTSLGITTAYLAAMDSRNDVTTYEGCPAVAARARETWEQLGLKNIACRVGEIDVSQLAQEWDMIDVAFVDANHTYAGTRAYVNILLQKMHAKSVLVVDDIHYNADMERAWREICEDERVTSTMDLYQMGLVFFDEHYWKRHYVMKL